MHTPILHPQTQTAKEKLDALWVKIEANETSHGFMSPMQTAVRVGNITYLGLMGSTAFGDERPVGHEKISHGIAGHASTSMCVCCVHTLVL